MPSSRQLLAPALIGLALAVLASRNGVDQAWLAQQWASLRHRALGTSTASMPSRPTIVVIGGGLAGVSAARTVQTASSSDATVDLFVVDKEPRLGGNSAKASSGINALAPEAGDSVAAFEQDVLASGQGLSEQALVHRLVVRAG